MNFASDNSGPAHPRVIDALARANDGHAISYGKDDLTAQVTAMLRETFEAPDAEVLLIGTGTAANSVALATLVQPWQVIYCSDVAHIWADECGAPEMMSGGARLVTVPATHGKITPDALRETIEAGLQQATNFGQPGALSITQLTEDGTAYTLDELAALADVARAFGLPVHMDGARFANAVAALGCSPAEMARAAGVTALSFGGTKNGCVGVEALILFDPAKGAEGTFRRRRAGHLVSKHRYLAAQMAAYLDGELWLDLARSANRAMARLAAGMARVPGAEILHPVDGNMMFVALPRATHRRAIDGGAFYYLTLEEIAGGADDDPIPARLVCDWSMGDGSVDRLIALMTG